MTQVIWKYVDPTGLPPSVDLRHEDVPDVSQGSLNACTANASVDPIEIYEAVCNKNPVTLSRLFQYYNSRGYVPAEANADTGAMPANMMLALAQFGLCHESTWPYDESQVEVKPHADAYTEALNYTINEYATLNANMGFTYYKGYDNAAFNQLKAALAMGHPVLVEMTVFQGYESITGDFAAQQAQFATIGTTPIIGDHEQVIMGYDDVNQWFIIRNSWGSGWGDNGYCAMPYSLFIREVNSLWLITDYKGLKLPSFWTPPVPAPAPAPVPVPAPITPQPLLIPPTPPVPTPPAPVVNTSSNSNLPIIIVAIIALIALLLHFR